MSNRRPSFERRPDGAGLVLTERDRQLLLACYEHQGLTRCQLQQVVGIAGVTRCNQRLRQLFDHGLLARVRAGTVGAGLQPVYVPDEPSVSLLVHETGKTEREVRDHLREDLRASVALLPHDLLANDVRIALTRAVRTHPAAQLECWLNARESHDDYASKRSLRPDGYFRFLIQDVLYACYLEVDRGTVSRERWKSKIERYQEYRDGGHYESRFGLSRFRVLTVTTGPVRLRLLREATREVATRGFWFGLTEELLAHPDLARPHWLPVSPGASRSLVEE